MINSTEGSERRVATMENGVRSASISRQQPSTDRGVTCRADNQMTFTDINVITYYFVIGILCLIIHVVHVGFDRGSDMPILC